MGKENCARYINVTNDTLLDVENCIKEHKLPGPGCAGCPDYPPEWE